MARKDSIYTKYKGICIVPRQTFLWRVKNGMDPELAARIPSAPRKGKNEDENER